MKAERQQKERTSRVIQPLKDRKSFIDNRVQVINQNKFIESIGENTLQLKGVLQDLGRGIKSTSKSSDTIQRVVYPNMNDMWANVAPCQSSVDIMNIIQRNVELNNAYQSMIPSLPFMNFVQQDGVLPVAELRANQGIYDIKYGGQNTLTGDYADNNLFVGAILHEMMHIHAACTYQTNAQGMVHGANMHLPAPLEGELQNATFGVSKSQDLNPGGVQDQEIQMSKNWDIAIQEVGLDLQNETVDQRQADWLNKRITYAQGIAPFAHYDTVLMDVLYYMEGHKLQRSRTYDYATRMLQEANLRRNASNGQVVAINRAPIPQQVAPAGWRCYLTTACVTYKGLPDNCEELTILRHFRDTYLINKPNGKDLIAMYYDKAPYILANIHKRKKEEEDMILRSIYGIVRECVDAILKGDNEFAFHAYCDMVVKLDAKYGQ